MAIITKIMEQKANKNRISIFLDNKFCKGFDKYRIKDIENIISIKLEIGNKVDEEKLKEAIDYIWKIKYQNSWEREQKRKNEVIKAINNVFKEVTFENIGFGTDTTKIIYDHPKEKGSPDLCLKYKDKKQFLKLKK